MAMIAITTSNSIRVKRFWKEWLRPMLVPATLHVLVFTVVSDPLRPCLQTVCQLAHGTATVLAYRYELQKDYMAVLECQGGHPNKREPRQAPRRRTEHGYDGDASLEAEYKDYRDPAEVDEENRFVPSRSTVASTSLTWRI